jgi:hypothetical protein
VSGLGECGLLLLTVQNNKSCRKLFEAHEAFIGEEEREKERKKQRKNKEKEDDHDHEHEHVHEEKRN